MVTTPVDLLTEAASSFPSRVAFQVPRLGTPIESGPEEWIPITFSQFLRDVKSYSRYWACIFQRAGIQKRDVVILWIDGFAYYELVHIFALIDGGYIPQCIPARLPNPTVVYELAALSGARALLFHSSVRPSVDCPMFTYEVKELVSDDKTAVLTPNPLDERTPLRPDDVLAIYHTSGSTGNLPKLVRYTAKAISVIARIHSMTSKQEQRNTRVWMGSVAHAGQFFATNVSILAGDCIVQPHRHPYSSSHLVAMVAKCSINVLTIWSPLLSQILKAARKDKKVLGALQSLGVIVTSGAPFPPEDLKWGHENGLSIVNYFALTEVIGAILYTVPIKTADVAPHLFRPVPGIGVTFATAPTNSGFENVNLQELVISSNSPLFPGSSFASPADGNFHTGDFFEEVVPGRYRYRGRMDDWIKMSNATRCDTKVIEDHLRSTCSELISECVVVGSGRVCPAVFIERHAQFGESDEMLKREIVSRSEQFNSRRYANERVPGAGLIFVVGKGELPRTITKGNIRRKAVEDKYQEELDFAYTLVNAKL